MIYNYECGNCESTPCACEPPDDWWSPAKDKKIKANKHKFAATMNPKLRVGSYYKKVHWHKDLYFFVTISGAKYIDGDIVGEQVLMSDELVECDKNGKILEKEFAMSRDVNYFGVDYKFVGITHDVNDVVLPGTKVYVYKCSNKLDVQKDDVVVVENKTGLVLGRVSEIYKDNISNAHLSKVATAWVVDRVDITEQNKRRVATERREYVLNKLQEKQKQVETIKMYEYLANIDPEAKGLLEELKSFGTNILELK